MQREKMQKYLRFNDEKIDSFLLEFELENMFTCVLKN